MTAGPDFGICKLKLHYIPTILFLWFVIGTTIIYFLSTSSGHVPYFLPYISDLGVFSPERSIFGVFFNVLGAAVYYLAYIRYKYLQLFQNGNSDSYKLFNNLSLYCAALSSIGTIILSNFETLSHRQIHLTGAMLCFGFSFLYFSLQTWLSRYSNATEFCRKLRLFLSIIYFVFYVGSVTFGIVAREMNEVNICFWKESDPGYVQYIISVTLEWMMAAIVFTFVLSYTNEFKKVRFADNILEMIE